MLDDSKDNKFSSYIIHPYRGKTSLNIRDMDYKISFYFEFEPSRKILSGLTQTGVMHELK